MGLPFAEGDRLAKLVPEPVQGKTPPLKECIEREPRLQQLYQEPQILQSFVDATRSVQVDLTWNADGKLEEVRQPRVKSGQYSVRYRYDTSGVTRNFATQIEDAHGYTSTAVYDERFGEVERTTDLYGSVTRRVLDPNGRVVQVFGPYEMSVPAVQVVYAPEATVPRAQTRNLLPRGGGWLDTFVYMDGMSRTIQTQKSVLARTDCFGNEVN